MKGSQLPYISLMHHSVERNRITTTGSFITFNFHMTNEYKRGNVRNIYICNYYHIERAATHTSNIEFHRSSIILSFYIFTNQMTHYSVEM